MSIFVDILQGGVNSHGVTVDDFNAWATEGFLNDGITPKGIIGTGTPLTGDYAVQAQAVPNMTLNVLPGVALVTGTPTGGVSQRLVVRSTTNQVITIASNSTGGTRHDWVYIRLDANKMRDPNVPASDVADIFVSRSTSSSVDNGTPPAFGHLIAIVAVANAASSITNANITNRRVMASNIANGIINNVKLNTSAGEVGGAWLAWTPTLSGWSAAPAGGLYFYTRVGRTVTVSIRQPTHGTSNATVCEISLPFPAVTRAGARWTAPAEILDNNVALTTPGMATIVSGGSIVQVVRDWQLNAFATTGNKAVRSLTIIYEV